MLAQFDPICDPYNKHILDRCYENTREKIVLY